MISKPNYKLTPQNYQTRSRTARLKKRVPLLEQGCRERIAHRKAVYFATPIDQFHNPNYSKVRDLIEAYFKPSEWAIFEPARCDWTTHTWLKAWPRLLPWIDALVIWPRADGSVGFGVYQEASDVQDLGKSISVIDSDERLKSFLGFKLLRGGSSRYAQVRAGKIISSGKMPSVEG